jgi:putative sigma-54 modulation protein
MSRRTKALEFAQEGYNIVITGRNHLELTDAIRDHVMERLSKLERYTERLIDVQVMLDIQKLNNRVDIVLKCGNYKIKGSGSSNDMYVSVDQAVHRIKEQLLKYKDKLQDHHARGVPAIEMNVNVIHSPQEEELFDLNDQIDTENQRQLERHYRPHQVVKRESRPLKTLTLEEAVMKMELSGDPFLIYIAENDRKIKVIYLRKDGNYGIMEPQA